MILNTIIFAAILTGFMMLALGLKMLFDPDEKKNDNPDQPASKQNQSNTCGVCGLKDIANCSLDKNTHATS